MGFAIYLSANKYKSFEVHVGEELAGKLGVNSQHSSEGLDWINGACSGAPCFAKLALVLTVVKWKNTRRPYIMRGENYYFSALYIFSFSACSVAWYQPQISKKFIFPH